MQNIVQIFGYMRSGTSMCRRLLHRHPEIYITNEVGRSVYPGLVKFFRSSDAAFREMPTAAIRARWIAKRGELLREMWLGLSKFDEQPGLAREAKILGNKTPRAEFVWSELEAALGGLKPKYIYCLRDPGKVLRSKMNMHLSGRDFNYSARDLERSLQVMFDIRAAFPKRLFLFSVDEYSRRPYDTVTSLLDFLGGSCEEQVVRHMIDQPVANTMSQQIRSRVASGEEVREVVELTRDQVTEIDKCETFRRARVLLDKINAARVGLRTNHV